MESGVSPPGAVEIGVSPEDILDLSVVNLKRGDGLVQNSTVECGTDPPGAVESRMSPPGGSGKWSVT